MPHKDSLIDVPIVEFADVHKSFGTQKVLRGLTLKVPREKITFIIGRSGEGKSVTLKHIVGIMLPDKGFVSIDGESMQGANRASWKQARQKIGFLFQDGALFDSMTVAQNVGFALKEFSLAPPSETLARVSEVLELVGLPGTQDKLPSQLSIGEKKRVGLARALAMKPKLLLYDEPTTGMDSLVAELIDTLIADMQGRIEGLSSVVISHDVRSILNVAHHIILLHEGRVYFEGTPAQFEASTDALVSQFLSGSTQGPLAKPIA